jgi:hypothetical protein
LKASKVFESEKKNLKEILVMELTNLALVFFIYVRCCYSQVHGPRFMHSGKLRLIVEKPPRNSAGF